MRYKTTRLLLQIRTRLFYTPKIMASTLNQMLNENSTSKYFIEHTGFRSNHLAHGLVALDRLGCNEDRLKRFVQWYKPKLELPENDTEYKYEDIDELKGKRVAYYAIVKHFEDLYREKYKDLDGLVANEFPKLSEGMAGSAVHGMIHLGYGYAARNERVVIEGLAYLHHSCLPIVSTVSGSLGKGACEILDILSTLAQDDELRQATLVGMNKDEYTARKVGEFQRKVAYLLTEHGDMLVSKALSIKLPGEVFGAKDEVNVEKLARVVVKWATVAYTLSEKKNDFFLLHGVTCAWGLMEVCPILKYEDAMVAIRQYLTVLLAVYIAQGAPALTVPLATDRSITQGDWGQLLERTVAKDRDEHCYKLVQVCRDMARDDTEGAALYMQAAESTLENEFVF